MSLADDSQFDNEEIDAFLDEVFIDLDWLTVKTSDINAVTEALGLDSCRKGSFGDLDKLTNTFIFSAQSKSDWIIVIHEWEPRGSSKEYLDSIEQVLIQLSQYFGVAHSFANYEDHIAYVHWIFAQDGKLRRSFARASETSLSRNFGEMTEEEQFIDWTDEDIFPGIKEVVKIAKQWSVEPIHADYPGDIVGVVGHKSLLVQQ